MDRFPDQLVHPNGVLITLVPDVVCVAGTTGRVSITVLQQLYEGIDLVIESDRNPSDDRFADQSFGLLNTGSNRVFVRTRNGSPFPGRPPTLPSGILWVAPVYEMPVPAGVERICPVPDELIVEILDVDAGKDILRELEHEGFVVDSRQLRDIPRHHLLRVPDSFARPAYEQWEELQERFGHALEVDVDYLPMHVPTAIVPADPLFAQQRNMERIRAGGAGATAWDLEQGDPAVVICILDSGCQLNHPDLVDRYVNNGINLGTMSGTGAPTGDNGTACAGLAAASIGNNIGIAGVAGGCRILRSRSTCGTPRSSWPASVTR